MHFVRRNAPKGTRVRYRGATDRQVRWGNNDDPRGILVEGEVYTIERIEIHSLHTKIVLQEVPGKKFNSISFEEVLGKGES